MAFHRPGPGSASGSASSSGSGFHFLNLPFGDTTYTKVFVGGLAWETNSETLRQYFEQFGEILEAVVIADKNTGRSKGYGFVTFRDPEYARRACADPNPVIDGRRANCNLASLGRPNSILPPVRPRLAGHFLGGFPVPRGAYYGSNHQQSVPITYPPGFQYPQYSYPAYGPEYVYPQNAYGPYQGQQYLQAYGFPGAVNPAIYPVGQLGPPAPSGHGLFTAQGYTLPSPLVHFTGASVNGMTGVPQLTVQTPYPPGLIAPVQNQPHFIVPVHSAQFQKSGGSEQAASKPKTAAGIRPQQWLRYWGKFSCLSSHFTGYLHGQGHAAFPPAHGVESRRAWVYVRRHFKS